MKPRPNPLLRISAAVALTCIASAHAADIAFSSSTPLTFTDTQSYDNGTVDRIGGGTGTVVTFESPANYTFSGNLTLTGAWNRVTLNTGAVLNVAGTLGVDVSGVSLNGGTLTAGALLLGDNPNFVGTLSDGKQTLEWGDSVINGSTIVANQSNASFISMGANSGFSVNWLWINGDGATIDSNGFNIGNTMNTWGSGGLTKTGSGTLSLAASNNFTGNTVVSNGVLEVTTTGKLYGGGYTASPVITVASGGTLRLNGWSWDAAGSIANLDYGRDRLVLNGGTIEYTGNSNFNTGDPGSSSRNLTIGTGGATLKASSTAGQTWTLNSANGNLINNESLTLDGSGAGEIQKVIEGSGSVTKTGSGTWTLSGANTYSGSTTVSSGTLSLSTPSLENASSVVIGTTPGATMDLDFTGHDIVGSLQINGSLPLAAGSYNSSHPTYGTYFTGSGTLIVAPAANGTWTSLANGNWEDPANWSANTIAIGAGNTATFNAATGSTVTLTGGLTIGSLVFDVSDYTLAGAALTLDASGTPSIDVASGRTATISADLAGTFGLEKTGAGNLVLTGLKSYTGGTIVTGGTLELQGANSGNAQIHGSLTVNSGGTVLITGGDGTGFGYFNNPVTSINVDGGTIDAAGSSHLGFGLFATMTLDNGGTLLGSWQWNGDGLLAFSTSGNSTNTIDATLNLRNDAGADHSFSVADGTSATDLLISGTLAGSGANVVKNDAGTMVLSGTNTYTGNTTVNSGSLQLTSTSQMQFVVTDAPASNQITGTGAATFDGVFNIDTSAVSGTTGYIWLLVDRTSLTGESFGSNFSVAGFTPELDGVTWTMSDSRGTWSFDEDTGELTLDIGNDYDTWKTANGVTGGETDDDDSDGLTNREEYAFGLDPTGGSSVNPITVQLNKSTGQFAYQRRDNALTSLTYTVWYSTDLVVWTQDTGALQPDGTPDANGVEVITVTLSPAVPTNPKLFIQVRAE